MVPVGTGIGKIVFLVVTGHPVSSLAENRETFRPGHVLIRTINVRAYGMPLHMGVNSKLNRYWLTENLYRVCNKEDGKKKKQFFHGTGRLNSMDELCEPTVINTGSTVEVYFVSTDLKNAP